MSNEEIIIRNAIGAWKGNIDRATKFFVEIEGAKLLEPVVPGRSRVVYILGHLAATHDRMIELAGLGERVHPEFDEIFLASPDRARDLPEIETIRTWWETVNQRVLDGINRLTPEEWLAKHSAVSAEDFAKDPLRNRLSILLSRTNHISYHLGQVVLQAK